ncbi:MAG: DUF3151 family protein [Ilumatobacteraceae bacterium]
MSDQPISMSRSGPPETVLAPDDASIRHELTHVQAGDPTLRHSRLLTLAARHPNSLHVWAALGRASTPGIEAYMPFRIGYHRGLDHLRASGWRGSGFVRWRHESNRGFLACLEGLAVNARIIGEESEAIRCGQFLIQLDPQGRHQA